jgi:hypothetical protein
MSIFTAVFTETFYSADTPDYSSDENITIGGETGNVDIPNAGSHSFNIWSLSGAIVILTVALTVGILAGIHVIGSGLSDVSQKMIISGILFMGLWACLTVISSTIFFATTTSQLTWFGLTFVYVLGMGFHMTDGDTA